MLLASEEEYKDNGTMVKKAVELGIPVLMKEYVDVVLETLRRPEMARYQHNLKGDAAAKAKDSKLRTLAAQDTAKRLVRKEHLSRGCVDPDSGVEATHHVLDEG